MNGAIAVESELGKGSVFTVRLPLKRAPAAAELHGEQGAEIPFAARVPKVLVVEDLPANVLIAQHFLDEFGFQSDVVTDGRQALERIEAGEVYDVILMDIQMPGMDGREATRRIRQYEQQTDRVPHQIIAITAHAMSEERDRCLAAGMDDYMTKPFDAKVLEQKLVRAIAVRRKMEDRFLGDVSERSKREPQEEAGIFKALDQTKPL
jgi:CheY-like chemotaxis protein